jgi:hypothetical protein
VRCRYDVVVLYLVWLPEGSLSVLVGRHGALNTIGISDVAAFAATVASVVPAATITSTR